MGRDDEKGAAVAAAASTNSEQVAKEQQQPERQSGQEDGGDGDGQLERPQQRSLFWFLRDIDGHELEARVTSSAEPVLLPSKLADADGGDGSVDAEQGAPATDRSRTVSSNDTDLTQGIALSAASDQSAEQLRAHGLSHHPNQQQQGQLQQQPQSAKANDRLVQLLVNHILLGQWQYARLLLKKLIASRPLAAKSLLLAIIQDPADVFKYAFLCVCVFGSE